MITKELAERNLRLYPWYALAFNAYFWMPVFFLYFSLHLSLSQVLRLEALYYVTVVLLEIPSGYFSDRVGRKPTLLISSLALVLSYSFLATASEFWMFAAGQMFFAVAFSFRSGTDVSFHYDSAVAAGRELEFGAREAVVERRSFLVGAISAIIGGSVGMLEYHYTYFCSLITALIALFLALKFTEPRSVHEPLVAGGVREQIRVCFRYQRDPFLLWIFGFAVLANVLNHIPYEFFQSYIDLLLQKHEVINGASAGVTGVHYAATMLVGSYCAARSITLRDRIGLRSLLLLNTLWITVVIMAMSTVLHPLIALLMLMRSTPRALYTAPVNAAIAPRVKKAHRATYFSFQSLVGRFAYGGFLLLLSLIQEGTASPTWSALQRMLWVGSVIGIGGFVALWLTSGLLEREVSVSKRDGN